MRGPWLVKNLLFITPVNWNIFSLFYKFQTFYRIREMVNFELGKEIEKDIFVLSRARDKEELTSSLARDKTKNMFLFKLFVVEIYLLCS